MYKVRKQIVAMLLAGGQGSRLHVLTKQTAKPAVPFGGKYRIIDFTLSNCSNSGVDTVGVLTQYQPLELNAYIGSGQPWDLDRGYGGVHILPPYSGSAGGQWYKGTANAVYQNLEFIDQFDPEYVLVLSGDHIYKMDYSKMLEYHKKHKAACTVAAFKVPDEDAGRFGIIRTNTDDQIIQFYEKPKEFKGNIASMGIYIFNYHTLKQYLTLDEKDPSSKNDFGANILPTMLDGGERLMCYKFSGYWKDVGTIESLWEANMDLVNPKVELNLSDPSWKIYSRHEALVPQYIGYTAKVSESMVTENCIVEGSLWYSVLFSGVEVQKGASLSSAVVMSGAQIQQNASVSYAIVADDAVIEEGAVIGSAPEELPYGEKWGIAVIGRGAVVKKGAVVRAGQMIEPFSVYGGETK